MKIVEKGDYMCGVFGCTNRAHHSQSTTGGTILLCHDCFGEAWGMSDIGINRLKEDK